MSETDHGCCKDTDWLQLGPIGSHVTENLQVINADLSEVFKDKRLARIASSFPIFTAAVLPHSYERVSSKRLQS